MDLDISVGRVNVEVFCARSIGHGRPHFDPSFTFNCQIEGTKTWRLARHSAVKFPPVGMFLGRAPEPDFAQILTESLPTTIEACETVVAEPGTVVFLPPGVLHETNTDNGSYAIAFAIERTVSVAGIVADEVRIGLQQVPELRAARLGAQFHDVRRETNIAADVLRQLAAQIENRIWPDTEPIYKLRSGLQVEAVGSTRVTLRGNNIARTFAFTELQAALLTWAFGRESFTLRDLAAGIPWVDFDQADKHIQHLLHLGLLERAG
jgi:hypothetical protein